MRKEKKLLIISQVYIPDPAAVGQYMADVAEKMATRDWLVKVFTANRGYDNPAIKYCQKEQLNNVDVTRLPFSSFGKSSIVIRLLANLFFVGQCILSGILSGKSSAILVSTSPPLAPFAAVVLSWIWQAPILYWVMDLNPDQMVALNKVSSSSLPVRLFNWLNKLVLGRASRIVVLDHFMLARLNQKAKVKDKTAIIPPWPLENYIVPLKHKENPFRKKYTLVNKLVFMYSGNHGITSPVSTFLEAAIRLKNKPNLTFIFIGGGVCKNEIDHTIAAVGANNIISLPYQPLSELSYSLSAADIHIVSVGDNVVGIVHPSKVYGAMAAGRPILLIGPDPCHISELINEFNIGWRVDQGDVDGAVKLIEKIAALPDEEIKKMGENARQVVDKYFSRAILLEKMVNATESELRPDAKNND